MAFSFNLSANIQLYCRKIKNCFSAIDAIYCRKIKTNLTHCMHYFPDGICQPKFVRCVWVEKAIYHLRESRQIDNLCELALKLTLY
jgi:hypothetical protein